MLNIVIPMAGAGSRFVAAGYQVPKPFIEVHNVPMIKLVIDNLTPTCDYRFIFIIQKKHEETFNFKSRLEEWSINCKVIEIDGLTEGAACTVLKAKGLINNEDPLMIANSDQYIDCEIDSYLSMLDVEKLEGLIMTMKANDPKWSFVGTDDEGFVTNVVEKEVISDEATVGIYNFSSGKKFVYAAEKMISDNDRVNGEFYVAPVYNRLIKEGDSIGIYNIGAESAGMYGLGVPKDLDLFLSLGISKKAVKGLL